jgi:hypothetical protein
MPFASDSMTFFASSGSMKILVSENWVQSEISRCHASDLKPTASAPSP